MNTPSLIFRKGVPHIWQTPYGSNHHLTPIRARHGLSIAHPPNQTTESGVSFKYAKFAYFEQDSEAKKTYLSEFIDLLSRPAWHTPCYTIVYQDMTFSRLKTFALNALLIFPLALSLAHCKQESVINPSDGDICVFPGAISFTKNHYAEAIRTTSLRMTYLPASDTVLDEIRNASDTQAARRVYTKAIDAIVDSSQMKQRMQNYFKIQLGVWSDNFNSPREEPLRYPVNLATYIVLSGKSIDELFLADYTIDDNDAQVSAAFEDSEDGPPQEEISGLLTMEAYLDYNIGQFKFNITREIFGLALNSVAPYTDIDIYRWDPSMLSEIYRFTGNPEDIDCQPCHVVNNWARLVYRKYRFINSPNYRPTLSQGRNQFTTESVPMATPENPNPPSPLEPRNPSDEPYPEEDILNFVKLTEDGPSLNSPKDLALALTKHAEFPRAWTERFMTIMLDLPEGSAGESKVVPDFFSDNPRQIEFLNQWTQIFEDNGRAPKELIRIFLKDPHYLAALVHGCEA